MPGRGLLCVGSHSARGLFVWAATPWHAHACGHSQAEVCCVWAHAPSGNCLCAKPQPRRVLHGRAPACTRAVAACWHARISMPAGCSWGICVNAWVGVGDCAAPAARVSCACCRWRADVLLLQQSCVAAGILCVAAALYVWLWCCGGLVPPQLGLVPPQLGLVPPQLGLMPPQLGLMPPQLGLMPPQLGLVPVGHVPRLAGGAHCAHCLTSRRVPREGARAVARHGAQRGPACRRGGGDASDAPAGDGGQVAAPARKPARPAAGRHP
eukprot:363824-Chlamydomonas_euryale.AAC.1